MSLDPLTRCEYAIAQAGAATDPEVAIDYELIAGRALSEAMARVENAKLLLEARRAERVRVEKLNR